VGTRNREEVQWVPRWRFGITEERLKGGVGDLLTGGQTRKGKMKGKVFHGSKGLSWAYQNPEAWAPLQQAL
jgi:hypothetical protein